MSENKKIKCEPCNGTGFTVDPARPPEDNKSYCAPCGARGFVTVAVEQPQDDPKPAKAEDSIKLPLKLEDTVS